MIHDQFSHKGENPYPGHSLTGLIFLFAALFLLLMLLFTANIAASGPAKALVEKVDGDVSFIPAGSQKAYTLEQGSLLNAGDQVITGKDGRAKIVLLSSAVLLDILSSLTIGQLVTGDDGATVTILHLTEGRMRSVIVSMPTADSIFEVRTPQCVSGVAASMAAGAVDTRYWYKYSWVVNIRGTISDVYVLEGSEKTGAIYVQSAGSFTGSRTKAELGKIVNVEPGKWTWTQAHSNPVPPQRIPGILYKRFLAELEIKPALKAIPNTGGLGPTGREATPPDGPAPPPGWEPVIPADQAPPPPARTGGYTAEPSPSSSAGSPPSDIAGGGQPTGGTGVEPGPADTPPPPTPDTTVSSGPDPALAIILGAGIGGALILGAVAAGSMEDVGGASCSPGWKMCRSPSSGICCEDPSYLCDGNRGLRCIRTSDYWSAVTSCNDMNGTLSFCSW